MKNNTRKYRNFMYVNRVSLLPNGMTCNEFYDFVFKTLKPKRIAMITHEPDEASAHIHMMLQFTNARYLNSIAEIIGDNPNNITIWDEHVDNGFSYLIHATDGARDKRQYSCSDVTANFDYQSLIERISKRVNSSANALPNKIGLILNDIANGELTIPEVESKISGEEYAFYADKIKKAHDLHLKRKAKQHQKEMAENNLLVDVHWLYGKSETGKTYFAETNAKEKGSYYKTTATKDPFQNYQGELTLILDDLRPETIPYSELLSLLDPFSGGAVTMSSRYYNKTLSYRTVFVTTPFSPDNFYELCKLDTHDTGEQLYRRLSSIIEFDMEYIHNCIYDPESGEFMHVEFKTNHYGRKNTEPYTLHNIFDTIE